MLPSWHLPTQPPDTLLTCYRAASRASPVERFGSLQTSAGLLQRFCKATLFVPLVNGRPVWPIHSYADQGHSVEAQPRGDRTYYGLLLVGWMGHAHLERFRGTSLLTGGHDLKLAMIITSQDEAGPDRTQDSVPDPPEHYKQNKQGQYYKHANQLFLYRHFQLPFLQWRPLSPHSQVVPHTP